VSASVFLAHPTGLRKSSAMNGLAALLSLLVQQRKADRVETQSLDRDAPLFGTA
jgi:hypothetical protein